MLKIFTEKFFRSEIQREICDKRRIATKKVPRGQRGEFNVTHKEYEETKIKFVRAVI